MPDPKGPPPGPPAPVPASGSSSTKPTTPLHQVLNNAQMNLQTALNALSGASPAELETLQTAKYSLLGSAAADNGGCNNHNNPPPPPPDPPDGGGSGCGARGFREQTEE